MTDKYSVDLQTIVPPFGPIKFLSAGWWDPRTKCVVIRFAEDGIEGPAEGICMDLDKNAFLNRFGNAIAGADDHLYSYRDAIRNVVFQEQRKALGLTP